MSSAAMFPLPYLARKAHLMIPCGTVLTVQEGDRLGGTGPLTMRVLDLPDRLHRGSEWVFVVGQPVDETGSPIGGTVRVIVRAAFLREFSAGHVAASTPPRRGQA